jgi:hypothetical protein
VKEHTNFPHNNNLRHHLCGRLERSPCSRAFPHLYLPCQKHRSKTMSFPGPLGSKRRRMRSGGSVTANPTEIVEEGNISEQKTTQTSKCKGASTIPIFLKSTSHSCMIHLVLLSEGLLSQFAAAWLLHCARFYWLSSTVLA